MEVLKLLEKQKIVIAAFIEGKAKRQIAREQNIDVKTVRRYIKKYEEDQLKMKSAEDISEIRVIADSIVEPPKYDTSNRMPSKLTEKICTRINELLDINKERRSLGMYKH